RAGPVSSLPRDAEIAADLRIARQRWKAWRDGTLPGRLPAGAAGITLSRASGRVPRLPPWLARHRETLRYALPAYVALILVLAVTLIHYGGLDLHYLNSLLVLSCFLSILSLGQGSVILTGGLD